MGGAAFRAEILARLGRADEALTALEEARAHGRLVADACLAPAFAPLRIDARFVALYPDCGRKPR